LANVVQIATSPRKSSTNQVYDALYLLTNDGQVWRYDQNRETRQMEWKRLDNLPSELMEDLP
jgi:hypothetical protein